MDIQIKNDQVIKDIDNYVSHKAEELLQKVVNNSKCIEDLNTAMWELGKPIKDCTDIENMLHRLIYNIFSKKVQAFIKELDLEIYKKHYLKRDSTS